MKNLNKVKTVSMGTWKVVEFESLQEFYEYITNAPTNKAFAKREAEHDLSSHNNRRSEW